MHQLPAQNHARSTSSSRPVGQPDAAAAIASAQRVSPPGTFNPRKPRTSRQRFLPVFVVASLCNQLRGGKERLNPPSRHNSSSRYPTALTTPDRQHSGQPCEDILGNGSMAGSRFAERKTTSHLIIVSDSKFNSSKGAFWGE